MLSFLIAGIATLGVDVGWRPDENGQTEYIIQLEPHQLQNLKSGDIIDVGVRPNLRNISRFQIVIGEDQLPRLGAKPTLSVALPHARDVQANHTESITRSITALRYPETFESNRRQDQVANDGFTAPRKSPSAENQGWNRDQPTLEWPTRTTSGEDRSVLNREATPQANQAQLNNNATSPPRLDLREQPNIENSRAGENQAVDNRASDNQADNGRRRLIDIGAETPLQRDQLQDRGNTAQFPNRTLETTDRNRPFNRTEPSQDRTPKASGVGVANSDPRTSPSNNNALGPRYGQSEPTLPRQPVDYRDPRYNVNEIPTSKSSNDTRALREMTRNLESQTTVQPRTGPANFEIEPSQNRYVENPRANYAPNPQPNWAEDPRPRIDSNIATLPLPQNNRGTAGIPAPVPTPTTHGATTTVLPAPTTRANATLSPANNGATTATVARPWFPLTLTLLALFASLGANLYLGWMTLDLRRRFRHFALGLRFHEDSRSSLASSGI